MGTAVGRTILDQNIETLFDEQVGVEDNETKRQREDVITGADFEKVSDGILRARGLAVWSCERALGLASGRRKWQAYQSLLLVAVERARRRLVLRRGRGRGGHGGRRRRLVDSQVG